MLAIEQIRFTLEEQSQLERLEMARGAWAQGTPENALLIIDSVLGEPMTPRVAAKAYVQQASVRAELKDFEGSRQSIREASPHIDHAWPSVRASFHHQRARVHKLDENLDAALTDYSGAVAIWEQTGETERAGAGRLNIAGLYLALGDINRAYENIDLAIEIFESTMSVYLSQSYDTLANILLADGRIESSLAAIHKALELVGDNESWQQEFLVTQENIKLKLLDVLGVKSVSDLDRVQTEMVKRALVATGGKLEPAGKLIGLSHKGVSYLIDKREDLAEFRKPKRTRRKSILKKHSS